MAPLGLRAGSFFEYFALFGFSLRERGREEEEKESEKESRRERSLHAAASRFVHGQGHQYRRARAKYSECLSRILMRRRKNLLRHRMRSNGGNTYKSREKGAHCRRLMACLGRRIVATCTRTTRTQGRLPEGLGMRRPLHRSRIFKQPRADLQEEIIGARFRVRSLGSFAM